MLIIQDIQTLREWRNKMRAQNQSVAFVPTMGNLHSGHISLVNVAQAAADQVIVSIFVNRLQFGQGEDFSSYPRTFDADKNALKLAGVAVLFYPDEHELYPTYPQGFCVMPSSVQDILCGKFRPGHFEGVATIVAKLFNIVAPDIACFGKKDYQQLHVIKEMNAQLNFNIKIIGAATQRAPDGLALSSRNGFLTVSQREHAPELYAQLQLIKKHILENDLKNDIDFINIQNQAKQTFDHKIWQIDYLEIRSATTLESATCEDKLLVILIAARIGKTRLIDNLDFEII